MPRSTKKSPAKLREESRQRSRTLREHPELRAAEQVLNTAARREARSDPSYRQAEQIRNSQHHRSRRSNLEVRSVERERDALAHSEHRADPEYRLAEQERNTSAHAVHRADPVFRLVERERDALAHQEHRVDPDFRLVERERDALAHQEHRADPAFRLVERERDALAHSVHRADPAFRLVERERNTSAHVVHRADLAFRLVERERDAVAHSSRRADSALRTPERKRDAVAHAIQRKNPAKRRLEQDFNTANQAKRRKLRPVSQLCKDYSSDIKDYPRYVCTSCGRCLLRCQIQRLRLPALQDKFEDAFLEAVVCCDVVPRVETSLIFCSTCKLSISRGKIPRLCLSNGFDFVAIPEELKSLTELEERLVSPRIPFMQIRNLPPDGQYQLRGSIVNVENDMDLIATIIPRSIDDTATIQLKLMRRQVYKRPYMYATIRPAVVHKAGLYLSNTPAYISNNVKLSSHWCTANSGELIPIEPNNEEPGEILDELSTSHDADILQGADDTLLYDEMDYSLCQSQGIQIAPAEGNKPIPLHVDISAEELSFPKIYCGKTRKFKDGIRITYTDIVKSELLRYDPRACTPTKVLYAFKKSYNEKVRSSVQIFLRKIKGTGNNYNASQVRNEEFIDSLI